MCLALQEFDGETSAVLAVSPVLGINLTTMQTNDGTAKIQSDARTSQMHIGRVAALIETLKKLTGICVTSKSLATVDDIETHLLVIILIDTHDDFSTIRCIFEGIGEQVGYRLVQLVAVYPNLHRFLGHIQNQLDATQVGIIGIKRYESLGVIHEIGLSAVQVHLVLVDATLVQDLVHQGEQSLRITVDGIDVILALRIILQVLLQFLQRFHDEGQR